ncbi:MAG: hypothetical protein KDA37_00165 [Planctomycetales bacterium]|nr:hypothetical protein [Planctomycetales bacterium]
MGDAFKKVTAGTALEIPAAAYNAMLDAAAANRKQQVQGADAIPTGRSSSIVKVKNTTGAPLSRFKVVGLGDPIVDPNDNFQEFARQVTFNTVLPTGEGRFGVLIDPLDVDAIGSAVVAGVVAVRMAVGSTPYAFAQVAGTPEYLLNVPHGSARVLWMEDGVAPVRWTVVRLDDGDFEAVVLITSNIPDEDGFYPGVVQEWIGGSWVSKYACKVKDLNS